MQSTRYIQAGSSQALLFDLLHGGPVDLEYLKVWHEIGLAEGKRVHPGPDDYVLGDAGPDCGL